MKLNYIFDPTEKYPAKRITQVELVPENDADKALLNELRKQALHKQDIYEWIFIADVVKMRKEETPEMPLVYTFANAAYLP